MAAEVKISSHAQHSTVAVSLKAHSHFHSRSSAHSNTFLSEDELAIVLKAKDQNMLKHTVAIMFD